jgi:hypothetical protein
MSRDPFDLLRDQLVAAAAPEAVRARRARRWRPLVVLAAALALGGTATATAVLTLGGEDSPPLKGPAPADMFIRHYAISIAPDLAVGETGWCTSLVFGYGAGGSGMARGCGPAAPREAAQIAGAGLVSGQRDGGRDTLFRIVDRRVAAVQPEGGRRIVPRADPALPFGWRAVVAFVPVRGHERALPAMTLLDAAGHPISQAPQRLAGTRAAGTRRLPSVAVDAQAPPSVPCAIAHAGLPGLRAVRQKVVRVRLTRAVDVNGRAFRSCSEALFRLDGVALRAAVLVDAGGPGRVPAGLPGARRVAGRPGVVTASGPLTARRDGHAWLVVAGGGAEARLRLLRALTIHRPAR